MDGDLVNGLSARQCCHLRRYFCPCTAVSEPCRVDFGIDSYTNCSNLDQNKPFEKCCQTMRTLYAIRAIQRDGSIVELGSSKITRQSMTEDQGSTELPPVFDA